jgi:hypothetical protein
MLLQTEVDIAGIANILQSLTLIKNGVNSDLTLELLWQLPVCIHIREKVQTSERG